MQLHRPKDISSLNEDFFNNIYSEKETTEESVFDDKIEEILSSDSSSVSSGTDLFSEIEEAAETLCDEADRKLKIQPEIDTIVVESETDIQSGYVAEQIEKLSNTEFTNDDRIFHDFSEEEVTENAEAQNRTYVDEQSAYDSFPDVEFDPSVFEDDDDDASERAARKESIKRAKEEAKATIENEKQKIKEQKSLEKTVQKPFAQKRFFSFIMAVLLVFGILAGAATAFVYAMTENENTLSIASTSMYYVDGKDVVSSENHGKIIAVTNGSIQGRHDVLFYNENGAKSIGNILAIGNGVYGIDLGERVYSAEKDDIIGIIRFRTPDISFLYTTITVVPIFVFAVIIIYLAAVIAIFASIISALNRKIRIIRENYELV